MDRPRCSLDRCGSGRRNGSMYHPLLLPLILTPITITTTLILPTPLIFSSTSGPLSPKATTPLPTTPTPPPPMVTPRMHSRNNLKNRLGESSNMFRVDNELILFCPMALKLTRGDNLGGLMIQVALLEEQRNEAAENEGAEKLDESKPTDTDSGAAESARKSETLDEKPDINDVPMEESQSQYKNQVVRQDLNESTLDLSLGLTSHEDEHDSDSKPNQTRDGQQR
ncbi:uncharacterized protein HKW66_Vig0069690 [Vigna angularis]|uniref:Uncharacterized protein n=1 Tax=Phaseolus angularis TaxID=3914 RepID=A0A8T0KBR5_PHAAN|nr:uncharacterized protein HKW66_Vig0069690 [Vigna angularis]